jgi:hypothetical protein
METAKHHEQPMEQLIDRTVRETSGWGRKEKMTTQNIVIFKDHEGDLKALGGEYVSTYQHLYPHATFHPTDRDDGAVIVKNGEEPVGVLAPLDIKDLKLRGYVAEDQLAREATEAEEKTDTDRYSRRYDDWQTTIANMIRDRLSN